TAVVYRYLRGKAEPRDPRPVVRRGGDDASDERAVALPIGDVSADEALLVHDPTGELGMVDVDARVDDGDPDRREVVDRNLGPEVERVDRVQIPLLDRERVVRDEGCAPGRSGRHDEGERGERDRESPHAAATT